MHASASTSTTTAGVGGGREALARERAGASFGVRDMMHLLDGGPERTAQRERLAAVVAAEPVFSRRDRHFQPGRVALYERVLQKAVVGIRKCIEHGITADQAEDFFSLLGEEFMITLHWSMFIPTLLNQATPDQVWMHGWYWWETMCMCVRVRDDVSNVMGGRWHHTTQRVQKLQWLPLAQTFQIIGCYAQTEMGHGSNVRGLEVRLLHVQMCNMVVPFLLMGCCMHDRNQWRLLLACERMGSTWVWLWSSSIKTTATYDKKTKEFVLNSPTLTSTKWYVCAFGLSPTRISVLTGGFVNVIVRWPGGLGKTSTHCVTHARLIVDGVDHGVATFIVQIRSTEDHSPMPGITVGDIGPKFGYDTQDNGFLRFNNVRIPREQMLMR